MAQLRPKITINKQFIGNLISPVGDRVASMICTAKWGPINTVKRITNLTSYINTFGDERATSGLTGIKGADLFFRNGGVLKVVRVDDGSAAKATLTLKEGASDVIELSGKYKGTLGNDISVEVTTNGSNRNYYIRYDNITESFTNAGTGYDDADGIITAINSNSNLITAALSSGATGTDTPDAISSTNLTGGDDGEDSLVAADYTTAFNDVLINEEFNYLLTPGLTTDSTLEALETAISNRANQNSYYSVLLSGVALNETIATSKARTSSGSRLALVAPGVVNVNRNTGLNENLDGSYLSCAVAGTLCSLDVEESGTHKSISVDDLIVDTTTNQKYYTKDEQEQLLEAGIIPVSTIGNNIQIIRSITRNSDQTSPLFELVIVDIVDEVTRQLENYLDGKIGKPNTAVNRSLYADNLDAILNNLVSQNIIETYNNSIVVEGNSPDTMVVTVVFKPVYATNFIQLNLTIQ